MYTKVKEDTSFVRDMNTRAILNVDSSGLETYRLQKKLRQAHNREIATLKEDVNALRDEIKQISDLLCKVLDK